MKLLKTLFIMVLGAASLLLQPAIAMSGLPSGMMDMFPIGRTFSGVKIPSYSDKDVLQMVLEADTITRVDNQYLDITNLVIKVYNSEGKIDSTIKMEEADFLIKKGILRNKSTPQRPRIDHSDFEVTGDKMTVNTSESVSSMIMKGNVRVVIPEAKKFTGGNFGLDELKDKK